MNRYDYIEQIEKVAADETTQRSLPTKIKDSFVEMKINDAKKNALKYGGAALGTAVAMKRGQPLGSALASGGMAGMATGDIAGSAIFPTMDLYKKHKQEFGDSPDKAMVGKILAANMLPTAGFWGAAYGTKAGIKNRNLIANGLEGGINKIKSKPAEYKLIQEKAQSGVYTPKGVAKGANGEPVFTPEQTSQLITNALPDVSELIVGKGGRDAVLAAYDKHGESAINGFTALSQIAAGKVGNALKVTAIPSIAQNVLNIPAAIAAPSNLIEAKKRRMEQGDVNG